MQSELRRKVTEAESELHHANAGDRPRLLERYLAALKELMDFEVYGEVPRRGAAPETALRALRRSA